MGIYWIECPFCKKMFQWFSGKESQVCGDCEAKEELPTPPTKGD